MADDTQTTALVTRLREGRTNGTDLRWHVTDIHREAAAEIERLRAVLVEIARSPIEVRSVNLAREALANADR